MGQLIQSALIVDDELTIRQATARALSSVSFTCETASDGNDAIQRYRERKHDLVITDLRMPQHHGYTLILELLKEQTPPIIVVLTGVANSRLAKDLLSRGVQDIVQKPVDFHVFAEKILSQVERGDWNPKKNGTGQKIKCLGNRSQQLEQIEHALEIFSLCIPPELNCELLANKDLLTEPANNVVQFLERLTRKRQNHPERRQYARISTFASAIAIPVNKDFQIQGSASVVTFCDLSEGGVCVINTRSFNTDYLALCWRSMISPKRFLQAVMKVSRCHPLGPFYEVGGEFVMHD